MYFLLEEEFPHRSKLVEQNQSNPLAEGYKKLNLLREKKGILSLKPAAAKELTTHNELITITLLLELTDQICVHTHFSY